MRIGIGGGLGPVRVGISNKGIGGRVGPVSAGTGWKKGKGGGSGCGPVIGFLVVVVGGYFVLGWPWMVTEAICRRNGMSVHGQHVAAWIVEVIYLIVVVGVAVAVLVAHYGTNRPKPANRLPAIPASEYLARKEAERSILIDEATKESGAHVADDTASEPHVLRVSIPARQTEGRHARAKAEHQPPGPTGEPIEPWGRPSEYVEVAGTGYRHDAVAAVHADNPDFVRGKSVRFEGTAVLVPDPANPHGDGHAVAVYIHGHHVGYVPHAQSADVFAPVQQLTAAGHAVTVSAYGWAVKHSYGDDKMSASFSLRVPKATDIAYPSSMPDDENVVLLPVGSALQVTGEEDHLDYLVPFVGQSVAVTLHNVTVERSRKSIDLVEIRLHGEPVGLFTSVTSAKVAPLVAHVEAVGGLPVARAVVNGNTLKADVVVYVARAGDVSQEWLDSL